MSAAITESIRGEVETKLERVRSEFREKEVAFQSRLASQNKEIEDVRNSALNTSVSRQAEVDARRLKAIDDMWAAVQNLRPMATISNNMSLIKPDAMSAAIAEKPELQQIVDVLGVGYDPEILKNKDAILARPYVTSMAWALYSAYLRICGIGVVNWEMTRVGMYNEKLIDHDSTKGILIAALPELTEMIEQMNKVSYPLLLHRLEEKLSIELQTMIAGSVEGAESVKRATEILKKIDESIQKEGG